MTLLHAYSWASLHLPRRVRGRRQSTFLYLSICQAEKALLLSEVERSLQGGDVLPKRALPSTHMEIAEATPPTGSGGGGMIFSTKFGQEEQVLY